MKVEKMTLPIFTVNQQLCFMFFFFPIDSQKYEICVNAITTLFQQWQKARIQICLFLSLLLSQAKKLFIRQCQVIKFLPFSNFFISFWVNSFKTFPPSSWIKNKTDLLLHITQFFVAPTSSYMTLGTCNTDISTDNFVINNLKFTSKI